MKKLLSIFFLFIVITGYSQNPLQKVLKTYFRAHPFDMKFSSFVTSLQKDPWFTLEEYYRRTDSNFFFLSGTYKNFNPFKTSPKEFRLILAEEEIIHVDSLKTHDTIMNLQLMCITDTGIINSKAVKKEFDRFHSNQSNNFYSQTYNAQYDKGIKIAESYNYFIFPFQISPVTIAWGALPETRQYTFTITIRFKLKENYADMIVVPGELRTTTWTIESNIDQ